MAENVFSTFDISGKGMSVQRMRLSAVAKNIANANTTKGPDGLPYKRDVVLVRAVPDSPFNEQLGSQITLSMTAKEHIPNASSVDENPENKILNATTAKDTAPPRMVYDPSHPDADENGYVLMPNINIVTEMVDMITAQRAFEANTNVVESAKNMARDSLDI
ncbi:MAG: flagellar basal body rod protein FlgC [FCB group bacterium]|jgi:flagellar basal-body rod protein FlgC